MSAPDMGAPGEADFSARQFSDSHGQVHFWEYNSRNADGSVVDASKRSPLSKQLDKNKDARVIADYSSPSVVLGGWTPRIRPASATVK